MSGGVDRGRRLRHARLAGRARLCALSSFCARRFGKCSRATPSPHLSAGGSSPSKSIWKRVHRQLTPTQASLSRRDAPAGRRRPSRPAARPGLIESLKDLKMRTTPPLQSRSQAEFRAISKLGNLRECDIVVTEIVECFTLKFGRPSSGDSRAAIMLYCAVPCDQDGIIADNSAVFW